MCGEFKTKFEFSTLRVHKIEYNFISNLRNICLLVWRLSDFYNTLDRDKNKSSPTKKSKSTKSVLAMALDFCK